MSSKEYPEHSKLMINSLQELKTEEQLCDVTIIAGNEKIAVHRLVLVAASKYFRAMFFNDTRESKTGIIEFPGTPQDIVKQCIEFIYSGKIEFSLKKISEFIKTSDIIGLHNLTDLYVEFLSENICLENVVEIISVAQLYNRETLTKSIQDFLVVNFDAFVKSESYLSLEHDYFDYMMSLVDDAGDGKADLKVNAIMNWIKHDQDERNCHFVELFRKIDVSLLSKEFIKQHIMCETFVYDSKECLQIITDSFLADKKPCKREIDGHGDSGGPTSSSKRCKTGNKTGTRKKLTHVVTCNLNTKLVYRGDFKNKHWSRVTELPATITLQNLNITEYEGDIYLGNGIQMWRFDGTDWKLLWTGQQGTNAGLQYTYHCCCFNQCFGSGGYVFMVTSRSSVIYQLSTAEAHCVYSSTYGRGANFFIGSSPNNIYIMGGENSGKSVTVLNINGRYYSILGSMMYSRVSGVGLWYENTLYAIGGGSKPVEFYNSITKQWQIVKNLEIDRSGVTPYLGNKLYLVNVASQAVVQSVELEKIHVPDEEKQPTRRDVQFEVCCLSFS